MTGRRIVQAATHWGPPVHARIRQGLRAQGRGGVAAAASDQLAALSLRPLAERLSRTQDTQRHNGSSSIAGTVSDGSDVADASLAGSVGGPFPTSQGGWLFVTVFHQMDEFVALPLCFEDEWPPSGGIHAVEMLGAQDVRGMNLDEG